MNPTAEKLFKLAKSLEPQNGFFGYFDLVDALGSNPDALVQFKSILTDATLGELDSIEEADETYGWIVMGAADALDLLPDDPRQFLSEQDINALPENQKLGALCSACICNDVETLRRLAGQVDVNALDHNQQAPLGYAVGNNHPECVRVLLQHNADPNRVQNWGNTQMHICASSGSSKRIFDLLREAGGKLDTLNDNGESVIDLLKQFGRNDWLNP